MVRPQHRSGLSFGETSIAVHVRLGDFAAAPQSPFATAAVNVRQPLAWYSRAIELIRDALGNVPAFVFSDGSDQEVAELLAMPSTTRAHFGSSIADLLAMSRAGALVASGSTFSMWASYLGRMPVIWHTGQHRQQLYLDSPAAETELGEAGGLSLPFVEALKSRWSRGS